jgi:1,4-dihydroxy-2-naphthoate octaprenyltransferase
VARRGGSAPSSPTFGSWSPSRAFGLATALLACNPVLLGTMYARQQAFPVRTGTLALLLVATLLASAAGALARAARTATPLAWGALALSVVAIFALVPLTGAAIFGIGVTALALSALYVVPLPRDLAGLGELAVFLVSGPLLVQAGYYAQSSELSTGALLVSLPIGLLTASVAFTEHFSHEPQDQDPMCPVRVWGDRQASQLLWALPLLGFLAVAMNVRLLEYPAPCLAALVAAVPWGWKLVSVRHGARLERVRGATLFLLALDVAAGLLLVAGFLLSPREG